MEKFKKFLKEEGIYYLIMALTLIAIFASYFAKGIPYGAENEFHYGRIYSLAETLKLGIFPAKLRPMLMKGFGYGVGFFYPDFFSYFPAVLILLGVETVAAMKAMIVISGIIGAINIYKTVDRLVNDKRIAIVFDVLYFGTLFMWANLIDGFGVGCFISQLFLPMCFCGLTRAFRDEKSGYIEYGIGIVIIVLSHHLTFISMFVAMLMMVLINIKTIIKNPKIMKKLLFVSFIGLFFTAQYWMPAVELAIHTRYAVIYDNFIDINKHILNIGQVIGDITLPYLIVFIVATAAFIYTIVKKNKLNMEGLTYLIVSVIHIYLMQSQLFWRGPIGQFFAFFQSTERLIFVLMALMLIFVAIAAKDFSTEFAKSGSFINRVNPAVFVLICIALILGTRMYIKPDFFNPAAYSRSQKLTPQLILDDYAVSCGEWLPEECEPSACREVNNSRCDDKTSADGFKHNNNEYYEVWVLLDKQYYDVPYVYYYGYHAYLLDDNGNPFKELEVGEAYDDNGYIRVFMPEGGEGVGHLMVTYRKTTVQKLSYLITAVTVLFIIGYGLYGRKKGSFLDS